MPTMHKKPSKAELQAEIDKALTEIETPKTEPPKKEPEKVMMVTEEVAEEEEKTEPETTEEEQETETPEVQEEAPKKPTNNTQDIDYRKKFVESTREAQVLHAKNKQLNDAIDEASLLPDPTEEELSAAYSEWDIMSDTEKRLAKESLISSRRFSIIHAESQKFKDMEKWNNKIDEFADDPKTLVSHPELEGRIEEFKIFASKPTRRGIEFDDLVNAFLYNATGAAKRQKGGMFETGTGGDTKPIPKPTKIPISEARELMKSDYNKFKELLRAGKIELPT